jgi:hypothetical protein
VFLLLGQIEDHALVVDKDFSCFGDRYEITAYAASSVGFLLYSCVTDRRQDSHATKELVSIVVEKKLAHPCLSLRFTSGCHNCVSQQLVWQRDVPQLLGMAQPLQTLLRSPHDLKD